MTHERSGPAHSGNRPRFKRPEPDSSARRELRGEARGEARGESTRGSRRQRTRNLIILSLSVALNLASHASASTPVNATRNPHPSPSTETNTNANPQQTRTRSATASAVGLRERRASRHPFMTEIEGDIVMQVAAFASKLEHWLNCQRLASLTPARLEQLETAAATSSDNDREGSIRPRERNADDSSLSCAAHYDGHLCWPPTRVAQTAQLACPQLNWRHLTSGPRAPHSDKWGPNGRLTAGSPATSSPANSSSNEQASAQDAQSAAEEATATNDKWQLQPTTGNLRQPANSRGDANLRLARRVCERAPQNDAASWQAEPDYSQCRRAGQAAGKEQFDPIDNWIHLDSSAADRALFEALVVELERSIEGGFDPYGDPDLLEQWTLCIGNIMREQRDKAADSAAKQAGSHNNQNNNDTEDKRQQGSDDQLHCPIIFDGWRCWPATPAGETAYVGCPSNQPGFTAERQAHKICTQNGTWYRHPETNRYWSNYTTCVDTVDLAFRTKILKIYVIGNTISLVALLLSLIIFMTFKSLKCTRVTIHKNLFLSFITNNLMWIIWYTYVVSDATLLQSNPIECRLWHIVLHYFLVSNYFWMFCEGLYLHTLLVVAFVSEDKILKWFYILGWLTPLPITMAYAYNRSYDSQHTHFCWMEESPYNLILMAPIGVSLLVK